MKRLIIPLVALVATPALAQQSSTGSMSGDSMSGGSMSGQSMSGAPMAAVDEYIVYFGFDKDTLDAEGQAIVQRAAQAYRAGGNVTSVRVRGYTDTKGNSDYNRRLAERRADAVASQLAALGVDPSVIQVAGLGSTNLLVPTADGVAQAGNRRVEIEMESPPPPTPEPVVIREPVPTPVVAPPPPPPSEPEEESDAGLFGFTVSPFYAYNFGDGPDNDKSSHLGGLNIGTTFGLGSIASISLDQAGFYNFLSDDDGFGGRTALGTDINLGFTDIVPYIGANIGAIYGSGIEDDFFAGPRVGLRLPYLNLKVGYDIPFNRSLDEGFISTILGLSLRF